MVNKYTIVETKSLEFGIDVLMITKCINPYQVISTRNVMK